MRNLKLIAFLIIVFVVSYGIKEDKVAAATSPYDVDPSVVTGWSSNLGLKNFPEETGKRLVYDIYSRKFTPTGYTITTRDFGNGPQQFINFQGWAVLQGHKPHNSTNNETYIVARKVVGSSGVGTTKIFGTLPYGNLSATEDLEYNNKGAGLYNECAPGVINQNNETGCNMRYEDVGFDAYLPLNELFGNPNESASWRLFIVKRVDGHIVYSPMIIPFEFKNSNYERGYLSLSSGIDATWLEMNAPGVLRRSYVGQLPTAVATELGKNRYFTQYQVYQSMGTHETNTAIWYAVVSPIDGNAWKWANTAYWNFGGFQALLSYRTDFIPPANGFCPAPVKPADRYADELDFEVTSIDGKTVDEGKDTVTTVEVKRKSYAKERSETVAAIQNDINQRNAQKATLTNELNTLIQEEAQLENELNNADDTTEDFDRINQLVAQLDAKRQDIANKQCHINTVQSEIDHYQGELDRLNSTVSKNQSLSTTVVLRFEGNQQGDAQPVTLAEDETKTLNFTWKLSGNGTVLADINPDRETFSGVKEKTYENNTLSTPIFVTSSYTPDVCAVPGSDSTAEGVVRTLNSIFNGQEIFKEKVTTSLSIPEEHLTRRAGYGFDYTVTTHYQNDDPQSNGTGPSVVKSYMPDLVNFLPYKENTWNSPTNSLKVSGFEVPIESISTTGSVKNQTVTWKLPQYYVEEFSGNVFDKDYENNPNHNPNDKILDGGRKWYISFEQPDGEYSFNTVVPNVGINKLNTCVNGVVEVKGSIIGDPNGDDDFIKRAVTPDNPFPQGVGWNWLNETTKITSLMDWYNNWINDPSQVSTSGYKKTFYLTPETLEKIREFNKDKDYKIILGESLFDSVNIPVKK